MDNQYAYPSVTFKQSPGYRTQLAFGLKKKKSFEIYREISLLEKKSFI